MTAQLAYRGYHVPIEDLALNECTIRPTQLSGGTDPPSGPSWWELWFYVAREADGVPEAMAVPVAPNGAYREDGPAGRTWGLTLTAPGTWQVSPSINVHEPPTGRAVVAGPSEWPSVWHQTPTVVGVPDGEPWQVRGTP